MEENKFFGESHTEQRRTNVLYKKKKGTVSFIVGMLVMLLCGCSFFSESSDIYNSGNNLNLDGNGVNEESLESDNSNNINEGNGDGENQLTTQESIVQGTAEENGVNEESLESDNSNNINESNGDGENQLAAQESMTQGTIEEFDILAELQAVEEQAAKLEKKIQEDDSLSQIELKELARELYVLWDEELNALWNRLKETLNEEEMSELIIEERNWIEFKEAEVEAAEVQYEGGSIQALIVSHIEAELTKERVYELAVYLGEKIGQTISIQEEKDYSGLYVDTQGTEDIYSELNLVYLGDGLYEATIGLYRLTTLEGIAKVEGETLSFEDETIQVKGEIIIQNTGAVLHITESNFEYINQGDIFEFPEKR